ALARIAGAAGIHVQRSLAAGVCPLTGSPIGCRAHAAEQIVCPLTGDTIAKDECPMGAAAANAAPAVECTGEQKCEDGQMNSEDGRQQGECCKRKMRCCEKQQVEEKKDAPQQKP